MAAADYWLCDECGAKTFNAANLDYDNDCLLRDDGRKLPSGAGDAQVICPECAKKFAVVLVDKGSHYV
jgi:rubredoxin